MSQFQNALRKLVRQLHHVPQMADAGQRMEEVPALSAPPEPRLPTVFKVTWFFFVQMQALDFSIYVRADRMDSSELDDLEQDTVGQRELSCDQIGQWEAEVLQGRLRDLLLAAEGDGGAEAQVGVTEASGAGTLWKGVT